MVNPSVGIVVLNWNNYDDTKEAILSILNSSYKFWEVCVVDAGSVDNSTRRVETEFPKLTYIYNKDNLGFGLGNNVGIQYFLDKTDVEGILLMNNDVLLPKDSLATLVEVLFSTSSIGVVGPRIYSYANKRLCQVSAGIVNIFKSKPQPRWVLDTTLEQKYTQNRGVKKLPGACFFVKRAVLETIGMFDPRFFLYYADTDLQKRITTAGFELLEIPKAKVYHKISQTTRGNVIYLQSSL